MPTRQGEGEQGWSSCESRIHDRNSNHISAVGVWDSTREDKLLMTWAPSAKAKKGARVLGLSPPFVVESVTS